MPNIPTGRWWRRGPEWALAAVASLAFLGFLGSTELWGKREQRAAAEALDTVDQGHWLVGSIQGRPRLEKPPLPRWITAGSMIISGRRDEVAVRLPAALGALAVVALAYAWGRAAGGRAVGLASGFALAAMPFFVVEMRQAGNDGFLTLFSTLGLFALGRRLGLVGPHAAGAAREPGPVAWTWLGGAAVGLGFLCKGPVIWLWVGVPLAGCLLAERRLRAGLRLLGGRGGPATVAIVAALTLAWPVAVAVQHPAAWGVWGLEIGQKTGALGIDHGNPRGSIWIEALGTTLPWTPLALAGLLGPLRVRLRLRLRRIDRGAGAAGTGASASALAWWTAVGPLVVLGLWDVAKPSYYLPALPAVAVLVGLGWIRLTARARDLAPGWPARTILQVAWSGLFAAAVAAPVVAHEVAPAWFVPTLMASLTLGSAALASARCWHLGRDSGSLASLASGLVAATLVGYGMVAPAENAARGHRDLAARLGRTLPAGTTAWFFDDLDEALWFYGPALDLRPVPPVLSSAASATNRGHALRAAVNPEHGRAEATAARTATAVARLNAWADQAGPGAFLLIRGKLLDRLGADMPRRITPVFRETGLHRPDVALFRVCPVAKVAALASDARK